MSFLQTLADICRVGDYVQPEGMLARLAPLLPPERIANLHFKRLSFEELNKVAGLINQKPNDKVAFTQYATALLVATVYIKTEDGTFRGFEKEEASQLPKVLDESFVKALVDEAERANYMWTYGKDRLIAIVGNS